MINNVKSGFIFEDRIIFDLGANCEHLIVYFDSVFFIYTEGFGSLIFHITMYAEWNTIWKEITTRNWTIQITSIKSVIHFNCRFLFKNNFSYKIRMDKFFSHFCIQNLVNWCLSLIEIWKSSQPALPTTAQSVLKKRFEEEHEFPPLSWLMSLLKIIYPLNLKSSWIFFYSCNERHENNLNRLNS